MLLKIEKTLQSRSLEKMDVVPGEMITFHIQDGLGEDWKSYCMSARFLNRMLTKFQNEKEAEQTVGDLIQFRPINGHAFIGIDDEDDTES